MWIFPVTLNSFYMCSFNNSLTIILSNCSRKSIEVPLGFRKKINHGFFITYFTIFPKNNDMKTNRYVLSYRILVEIRGVVPEVILI